jgi:hypothetical protein
LQKVILIIIGVITISGCSVLKQAPGTAVRERIVSDSELLNYTIENNISKRNFYITKASVTAEVGAVTTHLAASVKYKLPDSVLLILRSAIGTEAARMLMTSDTVMINDRLNKELLVGKPGIRTLKYGLSPDILFVVLGDLIMNPVSRSQKVACINGNAAGRSEVNGKVINYRIDCRRQKVAETQVEESIFTSSIDIRFDKFRNFSGLVMPEKIELKEPDSNVTLTVEIEKAAAGWTGNIDFVPGKNYQIRRLR